MMTLENDRQLANTRELLGELQERYDRLKYRETEDEHLRRMSQRSLKKMINQLSEQIARYECRRSAIGSA